MLRITLPAGLFRPYETPELSGALLRARPAGRHWVVKGTPRSPQRLRSLRETVVGAVDQTWADDNTEVVITVVRYPSMTTPSYRKSYHLSPRSADSPGGVLFIRLGGDAGRLSVTSYCAGENCPEVVRLEGIVDNGPPLILRVGCALDLYTRVVELDHKMPLHCTECSCCHVEGELCPGPPTK